MRTSSAGLTGQEGRTTRGRRLMYVVAPAVVSLVLGAVVLDGVRRGRESRDLVRHTRDVITHAYAVLSTLQDAETGQRGFLLTGEPKYLEPHDRAVHALGAELTTLGALTRDTPDQKVRLDSLGGLVEQKLDELAETIELLRANRGAEALAIVKTDRGRALMDRIRLMLSSLISAEQISLEGYQAAESFHGKVVTVILIVGTALTILLALLLNGTLLRHAEAETRLAHDLAGRNAQLEEQGVELELQAQQMQEQATELETKHEELMASTESLTQQATELEMQTEELEMTNRALAQETRAAETARGVADAANRAKSEFLAMMSHELRTPLNAIAGYAQLMQLGVPEPAPPSHQDYLARIQQSQHHLLGVINSVLNLARIEAGSVVYDIQTVPVDGLLAAVEPLVAPQLVVRGLRYVCHPCDRSLLVRADPDKVAQILLNLLSNSVKFTPADGQITLAAEAMVTGQGASVAAIRVYDTGRGIPADKLSTIFDPFVQVDAGLSRTSDGAGLGLAISRNLARGMGGDLDVESKFGVGSTFTLTLPLSAPGDTSTDKKLDEALGSA